MAILYFELILFYWIIMEFTWMTLESYLIIGNKSFALYGVSNCAIEWFNMKMKRQRVGIPKFEFKNVR